MTLPCAPCCCPTQRLASVFKDEHGRPDANVQSFLDDLCDIFSCLRLRSALKRASKNVPDITSNQIYEIEQAVDNAEIQVGPCGILSIINLVIKVLGIISQSNVTVNARDLADCLSEFEKIAQLIQQILDAINGVGDGGGGNTIGGCCPDGGNGTNPPGETGFNPPGPGFNRGC